jgi:translation initiation factor IF-2
MELEIYEAFISAGVKEDKAKAAVESINREIDKRYSLHTEKIATRGDVNELRNAVKADLAEAKTEIIKWAIGSIFLAVGLFAVIVKVMI